MLLLHMILWHLVSTNKRPYLCCTLWAAGFGTPNAVSNAAFKTRGRTMSDVLRGLCLQSD